MTHVRICPRVLVMTVFITAALAPRICGADFAGGSGTPADPYQVADANQLIAIGSDPNLLDMHFILAADVNLAGRTFAEALIPQFSGSFDGNNLTISNLTVAGESNLGLFGTLGRKAHVYDLGIVDANVTGTVSGGPHVGALAALSYGYLTRCYSTGTISGDENVGGLAGCSNGIVAACYSTAAVSGDENVGGLVGEIDGHLRHSYSTGTVSGNNYVGGLVGYCDGDSLTYCHSTATVSGDYAVGGLVGYNPGGYLRHSYSSGTVSGNNAVGGLVGDSWGTTIRCCYSTAAVSGDWYVGGLVGLCDSNVTACYSTGVVSGNWHVGGLVGYNDGYLSDCYSTGRAAGDLSVAVGGLVGYNSHWGTVIRCYSTGTVSGGDAVGGLVGYNEFSDVTDSFWDMDTSGLPDSDGGLGLTTAAMLDIQTYLNAGWDFVGETENGTEDLWRILQDQDYPELWWEPGPGGGEPPFLLEDFETGDFSLLDWKPSGDALWQVTPSDKRSGSYSVRAGEVQTNESSALTVTVACAGGEISFWRRVSCISIRDYLEFRIDDEPVGVWSGGEAWKQVSFPVDAGRHTFTWTFVKTALGYAGNNTAWIDDIEFPARSLWLPDYMPISPSQYGRKTFEWTYGENGGFINEIHSDITIDYGDGTSLTGVSIDVPDWQSAVSDWDELVTGFVYNDGSSVKILGFEDFGSGECWYFSSDAALTSHPSVLSFGTVTDGMMVDRRGTYWVKKGGWPVKRDDTSANLLEIQNVTVLEGYYEDALLVWDLRADLDFTPLDWSGMDTMLGIVSPTAEETGGFAVAGVWIFGRNRGLIASATHEPDSGRFIRLAELKYR